MVNNKIGKDNKYLEMIGETYEYGYDIGIYHGFFFGFTLGIVSKILLNKVIDYNHN